MIFFCGLDFKKKKQTLGSQVSCCIFNYDFNEIIRPKAVKLMTQNRCSFIPMQLLSGRTMLEY